VGLIIFKLFIFTLDSQLNVFVHVIIISNTFTFQTAPYFCRLNLRLPSILNRSTSRTTLTSLTAVLYNVPCFSWSVPSTAIPILHFTCTIAYIMLSHDLCFSFKFLNIFVLVTRYLEDHLQICSKQNTWHIIKCTVLYFQIFTCQSMTSPLWNIQVNQLTLLSKFSSGKWNTFNNQNNEP
jgi:hypothetical protein